eukprot:COSAG02_NODE_4882_length_4866_cov_7.635410_1_plen_353_part_00
MPADSQYVDLYAYIADEFPKKKSIGGLGRLSSLRTQVDGYEPGDPANIRISFEKGKRLNPALMPDNVGTQGTVGTSAVAISGAMGAAFGDPMGMIKNLQETNTGGVTNAPLNANMRLFASKFGWVNMGFLNPPPESVVNALLPADAPGKNETPRARRRLQNEANEQSAATPSSSNSTEEEEGDPGGDLPDPNESGNAGFLRKSGVSADEFFIGTMMAIIVTPTFTTLVRAPAAKKYSEVRNKLRNLVLSKQAMCLKHKQFEQFAPAFDDLLNTMPEYEVPAKYSLSTMFLTLVTVQNMGICQCSLMAIFEEAAITTKMAAFVTMCIFPGGFILYTYITLRGVMQLVFVIFEH